MNILIHVIASPYGKGRVGGAETSLKLLAEKLVEREHNVYFFCREDKKTIKGYTYQKVKGVHVYTYTRLLLPDYYKIRKLGKRIHERVFVSVLNNKKIDLVYTYYNLSLCQYIFNVRNNHKMAFAVIIRNAGMRWVEQVEQNNILKNEFLKIFEQADSINSNAQGLYNLFNESWQNLGIEPVIQDHRVLDIGTNIAALKKIESKSPNIKFRMAMISRFTDYQKRQDILIEAMKLIPSDIPLHLTLVGNGSEHIKLESRINELQLQDRITILPFIPQNELWSFIETLDLLCHACDYEGLSKVIIESMGKGLPVLASDVVPVNEYVIEGETGFVVENTPEAWADKIMDLCEKRDVLSAIGDKAFQYVQEKYNPDINAEKYEKYFVDILTKRRR